MFCHLVEILGKSAPHWRRALSSWARAHGGERSTLQRGALSSWAVVETPQQTFIYWQILEIASYDPAAAVQPTDVTFDE